MLQGGPVTNATWALYFKVCLPSDVNVASIVSTMALGLNGPTLNKCDAQNLIPGVLLHYQRFTIALASAASWHSLLAYLHELSARAPPVSLRAFSRIRCTIRAGLQNLHHIGHVVKSFCGRLRRHAIGRQ